MQDSTALLTMVMIKQERWDFEKALLWNYFQEHTGYNETTCGIILEQQYIGKIINSILNIDLKVSSQSNL